MVAFPVVWAWKIVMFVGFRCLERYRIEILSIAETIVLVLLLSKWAANSMIYILQCLCISDVAVV